MPLETVIRPRLAVDLRLTLSPLRHGPRDPCVRVEATGAWWRATRTEEGPAALRIQRAGDEIRVLAWGPGADRALDAAPDLLGTRDSLEGFDPPRGLIRELHRRMPGLRITRSRAVFEALLPSIISQKVMGAEAGASYRAVVRAWGEPAPAPVPLHLPPSPTELSAKPYFSFHPFGIEASRAARIREAAARARRIEETVDMDLASARRRLRVLPGVGAWTAAEVAIVALGDADAVSVGDYHLPHTVAWALAREPRADDGRMLELLEPFTGHRGRVVRLLEAAGIQAPRFGPRLPLRSMRGR